MKKYVGMLMAMVIGCSAAFAAGSMFDGMSKEELGNYEILIIDKRDGMIKGRMSRAEYKVVRIDSSDEKRLTIMPVTETKPSMPQAEPRTRLNSVILHAGLGKNGLDYGTNGSNHEVSEKDAPVAGATYCRSKDAAGLCGSAFTNKTFLLGLKLDF